MLADRQFGKNQQQHQQKLSPAEMFLQDKPLCATWNGGAAVQGLVDATSTNFDIVNDPVLGQPRNFPLQWTATNEGWEFIPNGTTSYIINQIPYGLLKRRLQLKVVMLNSSLLYVVKYDPQSFYFLIKLIHHKYFLFE